MWKWSNDLSSPTLIKVTGSDRVAEPFYLAAAPAPAPAPEPCIFFTALALTCMGIPFFRGISIT